MYEYVPNQSIRHILEKPGSYRLQGHDAFLSWESQKQILALTGVSDYQVQCRLPKLRGFRFFSPKRLQLVPFQGYLLPVSMFEEKIVGKEKR